MRVLLFWSYYDAYLETLYSRRGTALAALPYTQQLDAILDDYVGWVPSVLRRIADEGHEVQIVVTNARGLQRQWALEHEEPFDEDTWRFTIPQKQVQDFAPDVLIIGSMFGYYGAYLNKSLRSHARRVVAWMGVPPPPFTDLSGIDLVLTSHANLQDTFRSLGKRCQRLLPAFEPRILQAVPEPSERNTPLAFMGSLSWAHRDRIRLLRSVARHVPVELRISMPRARLRSVLRPGFLPAYLAARPLLAMSLEPVYGRQMYMVLRRSKLGLNVHIEDAGGLAGNMRMFETTGAGTLLLTENAPNLRDLFEPDLEVVAYRSRTDLLASIRSLLADDDTRRAIAAAGQRRTLRDHSSTRRAVELTAMLSEILS